MRTQQLLSFHPHLLSFLMAYMEVWSGVGWENEKNGRKYLRKLGLGLQYLCDRAFTGQSKGESRVLFHFFLVLSHSHVLYLSFGCWDRNVIILAASWGPMVYLSWNWKILMLSSHIFLSGSREPCSYNTLTWGERFPQCKETHHHSSSIAPSLLLMLKGIV